jgi:rare lipoprotein A
MAIAVAAMFAAHFAMPAVRVSRDWAARDLPLPSAAEDVFEAGRASWYGSPGDGFAYRTTANGETMDPDAWTCAHRSLPFGTIVTVENLLNGRVAMLRVNDRGPYARGRVVDLSRRGAAEIGLLGTGVAPVRIRLVAGVLKGHVTRAARRRPGAAPTVPTAAASLVYESKQRPRLVELMTEMDRGGLRRLRRAPAVQSEGVGRGTGTGRPGRSGRSGRPNRLDPFINRES